MREKIGCNLNYAPDIIFSLFGFVCISFLFTYRRKQQRYGFRETGFGNSC